MLGSESCAANYVDQALLRQMQAVHQFILNVTTLKYLKSFKTFKEPDRSSTHRRKQNNFNFNAFRELKSVVEMTIFRMLLYNFT